MQAEAYDHHPGAGWATVPRMLGRARLGFNASAGFSIQNHENAAKAAEIAEASPNICHGPSVGPIVAATACLFAMLLPRRLLGLT